ncbi:MAG TPA: hypothetical protein VHU15_12125 [Stellaceae bacterium]|jgi:hypothetical protein|nr:hypothetical protein [Stellaceae bacterium]
MADTTELPQPTSTADTRETEPEVVAGISSAEGSPDLPLSISADRVRSGSRGMLLVAVGLGLGFAAARWMRRSS